MTIAWGYGPPPPPIAPPTPPPPRGPWCPNCAHEYRGRDGKPELAGLFPQASCPYCGTVAAPVEKKPFHEISKSELEKFSPELDPSKGCKARWYFAKILHLEEPKNPYAALGILGHEYAEAWLKTRALPAVDTLALKNTANPAHGAAIVGMALLGGIPHAPTADAAGLEVEREFHFEFEGVHYMGYKDYAAPTSRGWPGAPLVDTPAIGDWKFTNDLKWAPVPEALAVDPQAIIYGWHEIERRNREIVEWNFRASLRGEFVSYPSPDAVWLSWVYMQRGTRNSRPVRVTLNRDHLRAGMRRLNVISREILHFRELASRGELSLSDVPTNPRACKSFGKVCPFIDRCPVTPEQRMAADFAGAFSMPPVAAPNFETSKQEIRSMTSAFDALMNSTMGTTPVPVPSVAAPPPPVPSAAMPSTVAFTPPVPAAPGFVPLVQQAPAFVPPVGIVPPPAPTPPALVKMKFPDGNVYDIPSAEVGQYAQSHGAAVWTEASVTPVAPPPAVVPAPASIAAATAPAHVGPGRPPGTKRGASKAKPAVQSAPIAAPAPVAQPVQHVVETTGVTVTESSDEPNLGFLLLVNCRFDLTPGESKVLEGRDLIAIAAREVCTDQNVKHYGSVPFGMGPAELQKYLEGMARDGMFALDENTIVYLDANTIEGQQTLSVFERLAGSVIRGRA